MESSQGQMRVKPNGGLAEPPCSIYQPVLVLTQNKNNQYIRQPLNQQKKQQ
jgi:hypothetical protein